MVLPLLGLLGAGLLSTGGLALGKQYMDRRERRMVGDEADQALSGLGPEAGLLDQGRALMGRGLLTPKDYLNVGLEGQQEQGLWDRSLLSEEGAWRRAQLEGQQGRDNALSSSIFDLNESFQPRFDAISSDVAQLDETTRILRDVADLGPFDFNRFTGTPEGRAVFQQLQEMEERGFADYKREVYGDAEPPPGELERLRDSYFSATGKGAGVFHMQQGRLDRALEVYDRRRQELQRQGKELEGEYYRNYDRVTGGDLMIPGNLGGGVDVTRSDRNLINSESGGNWGATNSEGMSGRAQFSPARLDEARDALGINFSREQFLQSPRLQKMTEAWHWMDIDDFVQDQGLDAFIGQEVDGVPITAQGMRNVAHLGGKNGLRKFLMTGGRYDPADSNGKRLSDYLLLGARVG